MKELSIEEKAKRYDEAIEKAKSKIRDDKDHVLYEDDVIEIFPELKESEDKGIKRMIKRSLEFASAQKLIKYDDLSKMLAWLEKQGEHANFLNNIQIGDKVTRNEDGVLVNLSQLNRVAKKDEKQGEQKHQYISRPRYIGEEELLGEQKSVKVPKFKVGDFIQFNGMGHTRYTVKEVCGLSHYINTCNKRMDMSYTDANFELVEQKPAEWSEEDEKTIFKMRDFFIKVLGDKPDFTEDKRYEEFIEFIDNRLKSLRPQSQWKPSDAQMEALNNINITGCISYADQGQELNNLYQDLDKLREE